jgi:cytochrome b561
MQPQWSTAMDESSNQTDLPEYLQASEQSPLPPRAIQDLRAVNEVEPAIVRVGPAAGYTLAMQAMHWASVALCLGAFLIAWAIGNVVGAEAAWLVMLHRSLSVTILALIGLRLAWRQCAHVRQLPARASAARRLATRAFDIALYVLLAAQPLMGLTASMLQGNSIVVFGGIEAPSFLAVNESLARRILEVHSWTALLLLALIGVHVGAALHHRFGDLFVALLSDPRRAHHPGAADLSKAPQ